MFLLIIDVNIAFGAYQFSISQVLCPSAHLIFIGAPQPHKGMEYGDVSAEVKVREKSYELKGIIKKNSENDKKTVTDAEKIRKPLLSTSACTLSALFTI